MTTPHWREKAREALTRGATSIESSCPSPRYSTRQLRHQLVAAVSAALQSAYEDGEREGKRTALEAVGALLSEHGCDCECNCAPGEHADSCEPCLGCRIDAVLTRLRRGEKR